MYVPEIIKFTNKENFGILKLPNILNWENIILPNSRNFECTKIPNNQLPKHKFPEISIFHMKIKLRRMFIHEIIKFSKNIKSPNFKITEYGKLQNLPENSRFVKISNFGKK